MYKRITEEFRRFVARGNVIDMAVGIIMGTAFTAIVNALVQGIIMPLIGIAVGGANFTDLKIVLRPAIDDAAEVAVLYGAFIQQIFNFLIIALVVFAMVKLINSFHREKEEQEAAEPAPQPSEEIQLLTQIRDLLQK